MLKLQAAIKYGDEDLAGAKSLVDQCPPDDPDTDINRGISYVHLKKSKKKSRFFFGYLFGFFSGFFFWIFLPDLLHEKIEIFCWIFLSRKKSK